MFPMHCNKCFRTRESKPALRFQLSRCQHIICGSCIPKSGNKKCPVCNRNYFGVAIKRNMPVNVANYLSDPSVHLNMYSKISKFQCGQRTSYYQHFQEEQEHLAKMKRKLQGYTKLDVQLREEIETEKSRILELRNYIAYYERLDETGSTDSTISSHGISRPRTPSMSATDPTLTDNDADLNDSYHRKEFQRLLVASMPKSPRPKPKKRKRRAKRHRFENF